MYHYTSKCVSFFPEGGAFDSECDAVFTALYDIHMIGKAVVLPGGENDASAPEFIMLPQALFSALKTIFLLTSKSA